jgi:hypothetical protein
LWTLPYREFCALGGGFSLLEWGMDVVELINHPADYPVPPALPRYAESLSETNRKFDGCPRSKSRPGGVTRFPQCGRRLSLQGIDIDHFGVDIRDFFLR